MNTLPVFIIYSFMARLTDFFRHWYLDGLKFTIHKTFNLLENLDAYFSIKITFRYLLKPLFQDYSIIGYVMGFVARLFLLISGLCVYLFVILISLLMFIIWALIPPFIIIKSFPLNPLFGL